MKTVKILKTPPGVLAKQVIDKVKKFEMPITGVMFHAESDWPIVFAEGKGAVLVDLEGNEYIDFNGGFGSASTGYCHPKVVQRVKEQVEKLTMAGGRLLHPVRAELAERIARISPGGLEKKVLIANTGTEAVEIAIKLSHASSGKPEIIAFQGGFHGRFHGAMALSSNRTVKKGYYPWMPGVIHVPYAECFRCVFGKEYPECDLQCLKYVEHVISDPGSGASDIAAVFAEPIQGFEGFAVVPPDEFMATLRKICDENNVLLVADEVYTGFGRTGKWFACQHQNVVPDIITSGKGAASGLPFSCVIALDHVVERLNQKGVVHSATFLANPISCAAAIGTLNAIEEEKLLEHCVKAGDTLLKGLKDWFEDNGFKGEVRGRGLFLGVEFVENLKTKKPDRELPAKISKESIKRGLFVEVGGRYRNCLRITPPLVITMDQIHESLEILEEAAKTT
ncbi:MAG: aspartate aminotransferase family protein [Candidatus Bathyarchaeia archaeon]